MTKINNKERVYEGILWCDIDDGWVLRGEKPADTKIIGRDMFGHGGFVEGRRVRITIELLPKIKKCPACGGPQPNGPETTSGRCLDCDRTSPSTGAHLK